MGRIFKWNLPSIGDIVTLVHNIKQMKGFLKKPNVLPFQCKKRNLISQQKYKL